MDLRILSFLSLFMLALTGIAINFWMTGEQKVFADAQVESAVQMCTPYRTVGHRKHRRRVDPYDWPEAGLPCANRMAIKKAKRNGFHFMDSHWKVRVALQMEDGSTLRGEVKMQGRPMVIFKSGAPRDPDATRGLKYDPIPWDRPQWEDPQQIEVGDLVPVSYDSGSGDGLIYEPNTLHYKQHAWVWGGIVAVLLLIMLLYAPDGSPQTEEGRRYVQYIREKHWVDYT